MELVRQRPLVSGAVAVVVGAIGVWLVFGFFGFQTLFVDDEVSEANPFVAGAAPSGLAVDETTQVLADEMNDAMEEEGITGDDVVDEDMPEEVEATPEVTILGQGSFIDRSHPTSGTAKVITDGDQRFLRFENFATDNGPDLDVYLATGSPDGDLGEYINLAELKGNVGDQNYELTDDIDLDKYTTVFVWCTRFGVAFGAAALG
jgi:hypothetical protein